MAASDRGRTRRDAAGRGLPAASFSAPFGDVRQLPPRVAVLRTRILAAAASRDIEQLRAPIEWNEIPPLFSKSAHASAATDPITLLKSLSFDGTGAEMLRLAAAVFEAPYVVDAQAAAVSYVWPAFAVIPPKKPTITERLAMWRCVRFADLGKVTKSGEPLLYRGAIGRDGTWHYFWAEE
jgi:hypothetical protein